MPRDDWDDEDDRPIRRRAGRDGMSGGVVALMLGVGLVAVLAVGGLLTVIVFWAAVPAPKTPPPAPVAVAAPEPVPVIVPFDDPPPTPVDRPVPIAEPRPDVLPPEPPPAADTPVVLRNARRTAGNELLIDYESVAGEIDPDLDVLIVKGPRQRVVVAIEPRGDRRAGTVTLTPHVSPADAPGTVRVFVERKPRPGFYTGGTVISNAVTVN